MKRLVAWFQSIALSLGGPGLFLVAFLDSSFLSLPEINDLLIVWMVTRHKDLLLYYAAMSTLGSIAGCLVIYGIARKGGEALFRHRVGEGRFNRAMASFRRHGLMAVLVPSILPPPAPFKIFVLAAGVARVRVGQFALAIAVGRGLRYLVEGLLAVWYGDAAMEYLRAHGNQVAWVGAVVVLVGGIGYWLWRRRRDATR